MGSTKYVLLQSESGSHFTCNKRINSDHLVLSRHKFTVLGFSLFLILYAQRICLSIAIVPMIKTGPSENSSLSLSVCNRDLRNETYSHEKPGEFNWDEKTKGIVLSSFFWGYIITQIPGGILAQRYGSKNLLGFSILIPSVLSILSPLAVRTHEGIFILCRIIQGLFQGVAFPAMHSLLPRWTPEKERSLTACIIYTGTSLGTVLVYPIGGMLSDSTIFGGWPSVFYFFGFIGLIWFLAWDTFIFEAPESDPYLCDEELGYIIQSRGCSIVTQKMPTPWFSILTSAPVWVFFISNFGASLSFYLFLLEVPSYFRDLFGMRLTEDGFLSGLPYLLAIIVSTTVASSADHFIALGKQVNTVRKAVAFFAYFGSAAAVLLFPYAKCNELSNLILYNMFVIFNGLFNASCMLVHMDMSPNYSGVLMGIDNCITNIAGILAPYIVGVVNQKSVSLESWSKIFNICGLSCLVSGILFLVFGSAKHQKWNAE